MPAYCEASEVDLEKYLRSLRNNNPGLPVAQHFNFTGHSIAGVQVQGMHSCTGNNFQRKQVKDPCNQMESTSISASFELCARFHLS